MPAVRSCWTEREGRSEPLLWRVVLRSFPRSIFKDEVRGIAISNDILFVDDEVAEEVPGRSDVVDVEEDSAAAFHVEELGFDSIIDLNGVGAGIVVAVVAVAAIQDHGCVCAFGIELEVDVGELSESGCVAQRVGDAQQTDGAHRPATGRGEGGSHIRLAHLFATVVTGAEQHRDATDTQQKAQSPRAT